jgi:hypothetical protein
VAECYNDWPTNGLSDSLTVDGWTTDASRYVMVRVPPSQRHTGKVYDAGGNFTGFALLGGINAAAYYTRLEGLMIKGGAVSLSGVYCRFENGIVYRGGSGSYSISAGYAATYVGNTMVIEDQGSAGIRVNDWSTAYVYNVTVVGGKGAGLSAYGGNNSMAILRNVLSTGNVGGDFKGNIGNGSAAYCASSDGTADDWGGEGHRINQTFSFVDAAGGDCHLSPSDAGARDYGRSLAGDGSYPIFTDVDGEYRSGAWDIGADEAPAGSGVDAYGIPDAWKIQYFGSATGPNTGALEDWDHDGMNNYGEWKAHTNPTNRLSVLKISAWQPGVGSNFALDWLSISGKTYRVEASTNLLLGFPDVVSSNMAAAGSGTNSVMLAMGQAPRKFYRVVLEP